MNALSGSPVSTGGSKSAIRGTASPCAAACRALTGPPTVAQRIVRASTVYLIFTEGYSPATGEAVVRTDLADEAIRLGHLLAELLPDPEVLGLLALGLLQDSRRDARTTPDGDLVLLPDQDRSRWHADQITSAAALLRRARSAGEVGTYTLQAEIALLRRLGRDGEARSAYERALGLARQEPQRRFLERRLSDPSS